MVSDASYAVNPYVCCLKTGGNVSARVAADRLAVTSGKGIFVSYFLSEERAHFTEASLGPHTTHPATTALVEFSIVCLRWCGNHQLAPVTQTTAIK